MNGRILALGVSLALLASACGTASAVSPTTTTVTHAAQPAAATMSPAEMAAMGSPSTAPAKPTAEAPAAVAPAATSAGTVAPAAPTAAAPAATTAPAPTNAPAPTTAPVVTPAPAAPGTTVTVTLVDMAIRLSTTSTPAGTVTFVVTNGGTTIHELVVLQTAIAQSALAPDPANPGTVVQPGFLGKVANLAPGASGSVTLTLGAGSYVLICNEPAHYSALGMHTSFSVR